MTEEDPLDEIFEKAEEKTEKQKELERQKREVKEKLMDMVAELQEEEEIDGTQADDIRDRIKQEEFDEARELLSEARKELNFDDEEKQLFAEKFKEQYERFQSDIEKMKNSLLELEDKASEEDVVAYLFGKHSNLRKTDIRKTIEGISNLSDKKFTTSEQAQILSGFESELNKTDAEDVLEKLKEEI